MPKTPKSRLARCHAASTSTASLGALVLLCVVLTGMLAGCHRGFYRRQADAEARRLILEKQAPRWDSTRGDIEIDPSSRMFDPFSADHPPIPPDDPTAHQLMQQVDQKPGYPHWHANGDIDSAENPLWRSMLPTNEQGEVALSLSDAYRLALIHSPELQEERETLYLSALEVSIQRFGFDTQLFTGFNSFLTSRGRFQNPNGRSSTTLESSLGANGNGLSASRLGITGANFVVGLANTILWEFSGNNTQSANSLINFSLIQPLLRGAGRERILESLTQSERTLLANVRQLERFRHGFYLEIATGRNAGSGTVVSGTNSFLNQPGLAGANVGGYLGLLQQKQQIKNLEFSVAQFESLLKQFRDLFEKDRIDSLQVAQFELGVYNQQESLLNARIAYENDLDSFKILLGLPPDINIVIEDPFLDGFDLIDDQFPERLEAIKMLREDVSGSVIELAEVVQTLYDKAIENEKDGTPVEVKSKLLESRRKALLPYLVQTKQLVESIRSDDRDLVRKDIEQLEATRKRRVGYLNQIKSDIDRGRLDSQIEPSIFSQDSIPEGKDVAFLLDAKDNDRSLMSLLDEILDTLNNRIERINKGENPQLSGSRYLEVQDDDFVKQIPDLLTDINGIILELALLQATARTNSIEIADVNLDAKDAYENARCFRRDWMNARTALVDNWRQIEFFADQLESQVDLVLTGEIGNAGSDNPFRIRYEDGNIRAGFRFDAPIVRQSERNDYREALISYQQARRSYYQFADSIHQSLRQTLRNINRDKLLFELNRQNLQVNIKQVQLARASLVQPPRPGSDSSLGDVTARNLTEAIQGLTNTQNRYLQLWTEYEVLRRNLDFDMGTMELDRDFGWVDPGTIDASAGMRVAAREGIANNDRFCCGMRSATVSATEILLQEPQPLTDELIEPEVPETVPELPVEESPITPPTPEPEPVASQRRATELPPSTSESPFPSPTPTVPLETMEAPVVEPIELPSIAAPPAPSSVSTWRPPPVPSAGERLLTSFPITQTQSLSNANGQLGKVKTTLSGSSKVRPEDASAIQSVSSSLTQVFTPRPMTPAPSPSVTSQPTRARAKIVTRFSGSDL